jgi:3-oxoacyl-[acyl-carrier protein] reductase
LAYEKHTEFQGKVALITGGSRNIGRGVAEMFAAGGARVMVNASKSEDEARAAVRQIESDVGQAAYCLADVSDPEAVTRLVGETVERFGRIDYLVNNQTLRAMSPIESITYADWRRVIGVILDGMFLTCQAVIPHMLDAGGGAIVNMGGQSAVTGTRRGAHVSAAKMGVVGLTKSLALELADRHITVNCVHPWLIDTARAAGDHGRAGGTPPVGRMGEVEEVTALVRLLCGPHGGYITGQSIYINGGGYMP